MGILQEGQNIKDTYEVEKFLGEGAFAEVFRVKHRFLGRQAMKVFKTVGMTLFDIEEALGEAIMLSQIGHPNIVRVFDANITETDSGLHGYFTMENVPGGSLENFWRSHDNGFVPIDTTIDLIKQVCRGLSVAHKEEPPVVHRDIKPQNILVGYENDGLRARISDFGLAKQVNPLTMLATAAGTIGFKPPEVFSEDKQDSCAADVWAVGATLYLLLTDRLPYDVPEGLGWGNTNIHDDPIHPPSEFNADSNKELDRIVAKSLILDPSKRYQNAMEMLADLEHWKPGKSHKSQFIFTEFSKEILGPAQTSRNQELGEQMAEDSMKLSKQGKLNEAADLMEEAFNKLPDLRDKHSNRVRLWRCGISM